MNAKLIVGTLIGFLVNFLLGWLIWGNLLKDIMAQYSNAACMKPETEMNMAFMVVANLIFGFFYAYVLSNWQGEMSFKRGAVIGAVITVVLGLIYDLFFLAMSTIFTSNYIICINVAANLVVGAIVGGAVGWWLGRK